MYIHLCRNFRHAAVLHVVYTRPWKSAGSKKKLKKGRPSIRDSFLVNYGTTPSTTTITALLLLWDTTFITCGRKGTISFTNSRIIHIARIALRVIGDVAFAKLNFFLLHLAAFPAKLSSAFSLWPKKDHVYIFPLLCRPYSSLALQVHNSFLTLPHPR